MSGVALRAGLPLARGLGALSRRRGGGGTSAPGRLLLRLAPDAISQLGSRLDRGSVLVSATNGKTTTAMLAASILERAGIRLVHNQAGANMAGGVATALLRAAHQGGGMDGELGLFEVDELWLAGVVEQLRPRAILLSNLFRDQLDRYGELEAIADSWRATVAAGGSQLVLNADDPMVADLGRDVDGTVYFGVDDDSLQLAGVAHAADAKHCRRCGAPYTFDAIYLGHLGHYHCPSCGQRRPEPRLLATAVQLEGVRAARFTLSADGRSTEVSLALPGLYNVYNALAAASLATVLGIDLEAIAEGLSSARAAFGRAESLTLRTAADGDGAGAGRTHGRELRILLVKNPAGANEVMRTLVLEPGRHDVLAILNDRIADGRDVSWIWDADFELLADRLRRVTCSGTRAYDLATRLKYAGVEEARIVVEESLPEALAVAAADAPEDGSPLYALPTYTAMLALRELLVARGDAPSAW